MADGRDGDALIHYHGTPLTPRSMLQHMAGKHFCVPFANPQDADTCMSIGQSVMFDNGAFSAFTKGTPLDVNAYTKWLEPYLGHPHWAIVPDEIDGDVDQQKAMIARWPFPRTISAPVWHVALPISWLLELADEWPRICFGSSGEYWQIGTPKWCRRIDAAFDALAQRHLHLPWIHILRGLALGGDRWPFASADSVNVARNYSSSGVDPERMARRIDSIQCLVKWEQSHVQEALFA